MAQILKVSNGIIVNIEAKPSSREEKIEQLGDKIKVYIKEPAEKGKANLAIIKLFSKLGPCQIQSGLTSKKKRLIIQTDEENFAKFLVSWKV